MCGGGEALRCTVVVAVCVGTVVFERLERYSVAEHTVHCPWNVQSRILISTSKSSTTPKLSVASVVEVLQHVIPKAKDNRNDPIET